MKHLVMLFIMCFLAAPIYAEESTKAGKETVNYKFNNVKSVYEYLEEGTYVGNGLVVNIKHEGIYANGKCITGAVDVEGYNDNSVIISMTPPGYKRVYFKVDVAGNSLIDNQGYQYLRK